jgi:hypothetical protein
MTISSTTRKAGPLPGNGIAVIFPFAFKVFSGADLIVVRADADGAETTLAYGSDYVATLNGNQNLTPGGSITLTVPAAVGETVTIGSDLDMLQPMDITNLGGFYPRILNDALDRVTILIQQLAETSSRSLKLAISAPSGVGAQLPAPVPYALLGWNDTGTALENLDPSGDSSLAVNLASDDPAKGDALMTVKRPLVGAVAMSLHQWHNARAVCLSDFGLGDGVTTDAAAFAAAIAWANSRGGIDAVATPGATLLIPEGHWAPGVLPPITVSGVEFIGASKSGTVINPPASGTMFTWGGGTDIVVGGGLRNVKLEYLTTPSSAVVAKLDKASRLTYSDLMLVNIGTLLSLGVSAGRYGSGVAVNGIDGYVCNVGVPLFDLRFGAGLYVSDARVFVGGVAAPTHPASMTTVAGRSVFNGSVGFWDTVQTSNCLFERFDVGVTVVAGGGMVYQNIYLGNTIFDYCRRWSVYLESQAGGVVAGVRSDQTSWFVSWEEDGIALLGSGYHDNHAFGGKVVIAGKAGVSYALTGAKNVNFQALQVNSCNRLGSVNAAMLFAAGSQGFTVNACRGNVDTTAVGLPWRAPYGVQVGADADRYLITSCYFEGSTAGYNITANTAGSANRRVHNNAGASYAGFSALSMPASTVRVTNTTPFVWDLDFFGGTITGGYDKNVVGYPGALQYVHMRLEPGESFACGYSVAPSVIRMIEQ